MKALFGDVENCLTEMHGMGFLKTHNIEKHNIRKILVTEKALYGGFDDFYALWGFRDL